MAIEVTEDHARGRWGVVAEADATATMGGFERTACACPECVACCTSQPGPLAPSDLVPIEKALGLDGLGPAAKLLTLRRVLWASPGAVVQDRLTGAVRTIGTITPQLKDGRCVFLGPDDRCRIHAVAPAGCAYFDTHMPPEVYVPRSQALYVAIEADTEYQRLRAELPPAESWRPRS